MSLSSRPTRAHRERTKTTNSPAAPPLRSPTSEDGEMTAGSVFDDAASRKLEAAYQTPDVIAQRQQTLRALALQPSERADHQRMQRLLTAWRERFADPHLPRTLARRLQDAGFQVDRRQVLVLFNPEYHPNTFSVANGQIMADFAVARERMTRDEAEAWMNDLSELGREGRYFFSLNRYLFLATRAS